MKLLIFLSVVSVVICFADLVAAKNNIDIPEVSSDEIIDYINNKINTTWTAGKSSRFRNIDEFWNSMGLLEINGSMEDVPVKRMPILDNLPDHFDAREKWAFCKTISEVKDQSACGSCWAISSTQVMSDRTCIQSHGKLQPMLSTRDLISCCKQPRYNSIGCNGGLPYEAWLYFISEGIVTGGPFKSNYGCQDYPFRKCGSTVNSPYAPCYKAFNTPPCIHSCRKGYNKTYHQDKYFGKTVYRLENNEEMIKQEIFQYGPVTAGFNVYEDFMYYKSGVYHHVYGYQSHGHVVKVLGWGVTAEGVKYWLAVNSWNEYWGDKGYFRILRGVNECSFESYVIAGHVNIHPK